MNPFELTRALVDIESTTGHEKNVGDYLFAHLAPLATRHDGRLERMPVEPNRDNIFAFWGEPTVTLSTHMDTVPPFFASGEDDKFIFGRGACDAKGIIAAMIAAAEKLLVAGTRNFGLLFVVGEERNSAGAKAAAKTPRGSRFLINGEPTENHLAIGSKGALRYEIAAEGKLAHSAYPELGYSAIHTLLDVLQDIRQIPLPEDALLGRSTLNIGTIGGGRAPNVVADHAEAEIMFRTVDDPSAIRRAVASAVAGRAEACEILHTPAIRLNKLGGLPTTVVAFTTDLPTFNGAWGEPFLIGPGSIHVAHTGEERIAKKELMEAVEIYAHITTQLLTARRASA
ncbi:MAG TPA: M20/M25/M40 family metallo-hydrolase [Candidatus Acidoferrum sp.]|jgi:acetylornithine deacetylase|nr:M20/M25/M40 family metallo-hydrolase [Candidatus Acidoferrum sp.]